MNKSILSVLIYAGFGGSKAPDTFTVLLCVDDVENELDRCWFEDVIFLCESKVSLDLNRSILSVEIDAGF